VNRSRWGPGAAPEVSTVRQALRRAAAALGSDSAGRSDAESLLAKVLGLRRSSLLARLSEPLTAAQDGRFAALVERRAAGEPMAYILGTVGFMELELELEPGVLVPRPETEVLASWARIRATEAGADAVVVDVGTGSGALALALASALPGARIHATDVSEAALQVARRNALRLGLQDRVRLHLADLLPEEPLTFDVVVANLPYVAETEVGEMDPAVLAFEPASAVMAGADGLDQIRRLLSLLPTRLAPDGAAGIEIGWRQGPAASRLARQQMPAAGIRILPDLAGRDRLLVVDRRGPGPAQALWGPTPS
jgi:release factor glutamine methyltransferase